MINATVGDLVTDVPAEYVDANPTNDLFAAVSPTLETVVVRDTESPNVIGLAVDGATPSGGRSFSNDSSD